MKRPIKTSKAISQKTSPSFGKPRHKGFKEHKEADKPSRIKKGR